MITSITNQIQNGTLGADLARLRLNAGLKQAKVAEILGVDTSRISRLETGELPAMAEEVVRIAEAIGTEEAKDYAAFAGEEWTGPKPSFWHPSRKELRNAEEYLAVLDQFLGTVPTGESAKVQGDMYRKTIQDAADYLRRLDHYISFVGEIGVGKSTAICGLTNLLLPPDPKAQTALSRRVVLEAGSGRTTLCEVLVRSEGKATYGLVVQPQSPEEVFRMVSDFCASLVDALKGSSVGAAGDDGETRGVSEELGKALRNMAGLARKTEKGPDGKTVRIDPAVDLARECKGNIAELTGEVLKRIGLEKRTRTEFRFETESRVEGLQRLRDLFASVNKGLSGEVSLPRRLDLIVPAPLLGKRPFTVRIVDTKGVDDTAIRPDIRAYLDDARTLTVLCTRFNSAPDSKVQQLLENLVSTGAERAMNERVVVLVLARSEEVMDTQDDAGNRAENAEDGYRIKGDQVKWALSKLKGAKEVPVVFFDVLNDDHQTVADQIARAVDGMRKVQSQRIGEAGSAIKELVKRYGEKRTKEAQEEVRRRLRIFIEQHLELESTEERMHRTFISALRSTHARTVWATTRRNGGWPGLDAYHLLGVGTAEDAQSRSQPVLSGIDELLRNMLGDGKLEPARDYLNEIRRTIPAWREEFLKDGTASGREIFRAELFLDDSVWTECGGYWGGGSGYRYRVSQRLEEWFDSHGHLQAAVEKRVQSAWKKEFLTPLATLCSSLDLLGVQGK